METGEKINPVIEKFETIFKKRTFFMLIAAACVSALILIPVRVYQYFRVLEPETGFYDVINWSVYLSYILIGAVIVASVTLCVINKKGFSLDFTLKKGTFLAIASFVAAVSLVADCVNSIEMVREAFENSTETGLVKSGFLPRVLEALMALGSAIYFLVLAMGSRKGNSLGCENKLLALFPVFWCVCRLIVRFLRTISFLNVSDLFYEILMLVFLMLFFMAFAHVNSKTGNVGFDWKLLGYGLPAAVLCLVCFIPRLVVSISGNADMLSTHSPVEFCDLGTALFIIATISTRLKIKKI